MQIFKALSDETRLRIMILLTQRELCVCDLQNIIETTQSKISRHLTYLKNAKMVIDRRKNVWVYYSINKEDNLVYQSIIDCINKCFNDYEIFKQDRER